MTNVFEQLQQLNDQMMAELDEATFEQLEAFVAKRATLIEQLKDSEQLRALVSTDRNLKQRMAILAEQDASIVARMNRFKVEAKAGMDKIQHGKIQRDGYQSPQFAESVFFDKKN